MTMYITSMQSKMKGKLQMTNVEGDEIIMYNASIDPHFASKRNYLKIENYLLILCVMRLSTKEIGRAHV